MNNWRKTHHPCHICGKKAIGCISPDIDIKGLCFCKKHKEDVMLAYLALIRGDKKLSEKLLKQNHEN